jgi:iron complex outermembrane recepter protein
MREARHRPPHAWIRGASTAALLAALALAPAPGAAVPVEPPAPSAAELKRLPIEELLEVEVTSAAKRPQALTETAATVSVITGDEIRRSGARSLPEALRLAPGLHVARFDSRTWAISARGFNSTTANKMLVLIDGRSVYTPLFSGVFWDVQNPLLEDVERIEVVRGPGATLWGANAVNGVVNVITRDAASTQGDLAVLAVGDRQRAFAAYRHGGALRGERARGRYRTYVEYDYRESLVRADGSDVDDPLRIAQAGFRADLDAGDGDLTLQGDVYGGRIGHPTFDDTDVLGGNLLGQWARHLGTGSDLVVRGYYDHTFREVPTQLRERRDTLDLELQHRWQRGRHDLLWGGGWRASRDQVGNTPLIGWDPSQETIIVGNLFAQDELRLSERWRALLGLRIEDQSTMDAQLLPALTLAWQLAPDRLLWAGAARAVRAPTRIDRDIRIPGTGTPIVVGNKDFQEEEVVAYELGWRMAATTAALLEAVAFYNDYDQLRTQEPTPPSGVPVVLANGGHANVRGVSVNGSWQALERVRVQGMVSWLSTRFDVDPQSRDATRGAAEANDPDYQWSLRADLALPRDVELGAWVRHVAALPNPRVPAYTELDLRLGWRRPGGWELALVGQNLLASHHPEFGAAVTREEVPRGVYAQVTWRR